MSGQLSTILFLVAHRARWPQIATPGWLDHLWQDELLLFDSTFKTELNEHSRLYHTHTMFLLNMMWQSRTVQDTLYAFRNVCEQTFRKVKNFSWNKVIRCADISVSLIPPMRGTKAETKRVQWHVGTIITVVDWVLPFGCLQLSFSVQVIHFREHGYTRNRLRQHRKTWLTEHIFPTAEHLLSPTNNNPNRSSEFLGETISEWEAENWASLKRKSPVWGSSCVQIVLTEVVFTSPELLPASPSNARVTWSTSMDTGSEGSSGISS